MDPNANLKRQIELAGCLIDECDSKGNIIEYEQYKEYAVELAELVGALNNWLQKGGFPPREWKQNSSIQHLWSFR